MALDIILSVKLQVEEQSQVGEVRRSCAILCNEIGFDSFTAEKVAIVVTELGTNLVKHAKGDRFIIIQTIEDTVNCLKFLEIYSLDRGKGIGDIHSALKDGHSTAGSAGIGLGAIRRLSSEFHIFTLPDRGVAIYCKIFPDKLPKNIQTANSSSMYSRRFEIGQICVPVTNNVPCGDSVCVRHFDDKLLAMVVDGLGHGVEAAIAAKTAKEAFIVNLQNNPGKIVEKIHYALRPTRGAAIGVAEISISRNLLTFTGIGNIVGRILHSGSTQNLISHNGIVGSEYHKLQEFVYSWSPGSLLVMHSDGISGRWTLNNYAGIHSKPANLIASVIYRDFYRTRDDSSIVVVKDKMEDT